MTLENTRSEQPGLPTVAELRAALAASQAECAALKADVERLTLERDMQVGYRDTRAMERDTAKDEARRLAGSLERARGLLGQRAGVCRRFVSWQNDDGDMGPAPRDCGQCWDCRARAFLRPPTPIATPGTPTEEET